MIDQYLTKVRHEEFLAEAERYRLLDLINKKPSETSSKSAVFLLWFGGLLSRWGRQLEDRFSVETNHNQSQQVDRGLKV